MKNRIAAHTRWPLDAKARRDRASTDIAFFRVMREVVGERFITADTFRQYQKACEMLTAPDTISEEAGPIDGVED